LIARVQGQLYAVGAFCSVSGRPLIDGLLFGDKIMSPHLAASYSVITGAPESAPALDGIPSYKVSLINGKYFVSVPEGKLVKKVSPTLAKRDPEDKRNYVIVGGGPAGLMCAETLRLSGYTGKITILNDKKALPYDKTLLSKDLDAEALPLRSKEFLRDANIDLVKNGLYAIHPEKKSLVLLRGRPMDYDKLVIACGGEPVKPQ